MGEFYFDQNTCQVIKKSCTTKTKIVLKMILIGLHDKTIKKGYGEFFEIHVSREKTRESALSIKFHLSIKLSPIRELVSMTSHILPLFLTKVGGVKRQRRLRGVSYENVTKIVDAHQLSNNISSAHLSQERVRGVWLTN